jgi:hypothetical protein
VTVEPAHAQRLSVAVHTFVTSDEAHRPAAEKDLRRVAGWALGDHAARLTLPTPATVKSTRKARSFRDTCTRHRLLSDLQAEIFTYVSRGLQRPRSGQAGERVAAEIVLGLADRRDALAYLRHLAERTHRRVDRVRGGRAAGGDRWWAEMPDDQLWAQLQAFADPDTWKGASPPAQRCYLWMRSRAREVLGVSLDAALGGHDAAEVVVEDGVFGPDASVFTARAELTMWEQVAGDDYLVGVRPLDAEQRRAIDDRIAFLGDLIG